MPTLAVSATVTSRIRLGPLVASPNFRHPVSFARELITLDDVSGGDPATFEHVVSRAV